MRGSMMLFFKGVAMGAANVIPGVSGGTIAFITNIYEKLIFSLRSFDVKALRLLMQFEFRSFARHVNLGFLFVLFSGVFLSIITLGKILKFLFEHYPIYVWAFFFGLILASVYFVGNKIYRWRMGVVLFLLAGTIAATLIAYLNPANENSSLVYLFICGIVAMASMLLPGLSGSFILILMGNYQLIFLEAVPEFNMNVLIPVAIGSVLGFIILSRLISWLLEQLRDQTIALLTGFIMGSLLIIWPWKDPVYLKDATGALVIREGGYIIEGYQWFAPDIIIWETWIAILFIIIGILSVVFIEWTAKTQEAS